MNVVGRGVECDYLNRLAGHDSQHVRPVQATLLGENDGVFVKVIGNLL